jgi:uncharacterized surface protein with fasciclin (FAS1) repeats
MITTARRTALAMTALALLALGGCASTPPPATLAETTARMPQLSTLNRLIAEAGLTATLQGAGPFTLFAPSDDAFKAVPAKTMEELGKDKERLRAVLTYHLLPGKLMAADVKPASVKTVNGANAALAKAGTFVTFEDAVVTEADLPATNGVVHVIDKVALPPAPRR